MLAQIIYHISMTAVLFFSCHQNDSIQQVEKDHVFKKEFIKCDMKLHMDTIVGFNMIFAKISLVGEKFKVKNFKGESTSVLKERIHDIVNCLDPDKVGRRTFSVVYSTKKENDNIDFEKELVKFKTKYEIRDDVVFIPVIHTDRVR